ncbi:MAG: hypothetical protein DMG57_34195 [Acidobacteria bacterium]|nr:MAG: hypothetical protein DMG57_34195 [Acidobacteriota bacterium]
MLTIFVSAFLLFQIEPLIAKIVLPWFGGSAGVWTVCLLFFQMALLGGYLYAHLSIGYLTPRRQVLAHAVLLAASLLLLPVIPDASWKPLGTEDPVWRILGLLGATLGLPYFLLSSTSPLLQSWYARTHDSGMPYRLFALSNLGSMLALVSYPVLVEPGFSTLHQAWGWSIGFVAFALLCGWVAMGARGKAVQERHRDDAGVDSRPGWKLQLMWLALAACASTMLLAVTNHLTQNVASIPFLWILPLALYLLTFILCFEGRRWYKRAMSMRLAAVALGGMTYAMTDDFQNLGLEALIPLFTGGLFFCSMVCHGELARLKPAPRHLTSFYLMVSIGGAVGGVLVGLVAPHLFSGYFELPIAIGWCAVMMVLVLKPARRAEDTEARELFAIIGRDDGWGFQRILWIGSIVATLVLIGSLGYGVYQFRHESRLLERNFYGALRVNDEGDGVAEGQIRRLTHGTINHGEQFLDEARHMQPTTYYGYHSGVGVALEEIDQRPAVRVGVIGLGTGTLAAYGRGGDVFRFYDINPLVIRVARTEFSFLRDSKARIETVLGDARLSLEREQPQEYDLLAVDAFSSDAIPVHLLTREAFALYFRHLKTDGVLAVHVSNKHLNLQPIVQMAADAMGKRTTVIDTNDEDDNAVFGATWVLVTARKNVFEHALIRQAGKPVARKAGLRMWTDDYSNLFQILK